MIATGTRTREYKPRGSIHHAYRFSMYVILIMVGFGMIGFYILFEILSSRAEIQSETKEYEDHIKQRIKEEVENGVYTANYFYRSEQGKESDDEIQHDIIQFLGNLRSEDVGYFFASDYQGNNVMGPGLKSNVYNIEDKNGLKVVQELIKTAKQGGGYVSYVMPPLDGIEQVPKISYVLPFKPYNWYIGAGVNLSRITIIQDKTQRQAIDRSIQAIIITCIFIAALMLLYSRYSKRLYNHIVQDISRIMDFMGKSADEIALMKTDSFHFMELEKIGVHTANLTKSREEDQATLASQFDLIKKAADKLEKMNGSLQEEIKEHSNSLSLLGESQKRIELILNTLPDVIFILDQDGNFLDCEAGDKTWLQMDPKTVVGKNIKDIMPDDISDSCLKTIREALASNQMQTYAYKITSDGSDEYFEARIIAFKTNQVFSIIRNITDTRRIQLQNEYFSYHDQLTGVYNRRYFEEKVNELDQSNCFPVSIALLDLNGLKLTNDAFGHKAGDNLLCIVAEILRNCCSSPNCFIARISGDEFVAVNENATLEDIERMVNDIYLSVQNVKTEYSILSVSIGWDMKTSSEQSMSDVFNKAEECMYRKKITESQSMHSQTIHAIMKTLKEKNGRERIHSERVGMISRLIGEAMKLDYGVVKEIETAGLLHDIGKIAVDEGILNKAGKLTREEYEKIKKHPEISYQILKSINAYAGLADDVMSHHERWDGAGYPRGLGGEKISLIARIISIADAYEAMTADRSYRSAMSKHKALEELVNEAGTQFDPQIVSIFREQVFPTL